jgi:hypothetical protein
MAMNTFDKDTEKDWYSRILLPGGYLFSQWVMGLKTSN